MDNVDKRNVLDEEVFTHHVTKDKKVMISYCGKHVVTLSGKKALTFIANTDGLSGKELQLALAKVTGNFKRGNERLIKQRSEEKQTK